MDYQLVVQKLFSECAFFEGKTTLRLYQDGPRLNRICRSPLQSSIGHFSHFDARNYLLPFEYWPDERDDSNEHNADLARCVWLSTLAVQCLL